MPDGDLFVSSLARNVRFVNNLPRYALGIVFLIFGIDKFVGFDSYLAWFSATDRVRVLIPPADSGTFIYAMGTVEVILAILLLAGIFARKTAIATSIALIAILFVAQYPSSFPQDLGLLGTSIMLVFASKDQRTSGLYYQFPKLARFGLSSVLVLWAADHLLYTSTHVSWLQLFNLTVRNMPAEQVFVFVIMIGIIELVIGSMIASGKLRVYPYIASAVFFVIAFLILAPPLNNYQSIGLAIISSWMIYIMKYREA